jgi:phosphate-selective porin OprO/OprP
LRIPQKRKRKSSRSDAVRCALFLSVLGLAVITAPLAAQHAAGGAPQPGNPVKIAPPVKDSTLVAYDDEGLRIHSADGRRQLRLRGYFDFDAKVVTSDTSDTPPNGFAMRRARIVFDANVNPWLAFRFSADLFTPGIPPVVDAFADITLTPHWWIRAGKQKTPYGLERVTPINETFFPERAISTMLTSSRDPGVMLTGEYGAGRYEGSVGIFDGNPDKTTTDTDVNDAKDATLRLIFRPLLLTGGQGVTLGYNGTTGIERGTATSSQLPKYLSPGGSAFFTYRESAGAIADGLRTRNGAFVAAHRGPWGANAEWFQNIARLRRGTSRADVTASGWMGGLDYVISGENSVQAGVAPAHAFDPSSGHWGAWQAVARVSQVSVGDRAFQFLADSTVAARQATELGIGVNWFITRTNKLQVDLEQTLFKGGAVSGDRRTETMGLLRMQLYF